MFEVKEGGRAEVLKDRWNREVEGLVRRASEVEWGRVWERVEGGVAWGVGRVRRMGGEVKGGAERGGGEGKMEEREKRGEGQSGGRLLEEKA